MNTKELNEFRDITYHLTSELGLHQVEQDPL